MQSTPELFDAYELANKIVAEASSYRESGEFALVDLGWKYSNAESARRTAEQNRATMISAGTEYPRQLAESFEQARAKAFAACDAFVKEYDAFRKRKALAS